eukprot:gene6516-7809_t
MEDADFAKYRDKEVWLKTNPKGWIGIRNIYNKFMRLEDRKMHMTRDEADNSLKKGCDLHLLANMGIHARCLDKSFEETQFKTLFHRWYEAQAPKHVREARGRLFDFIEEQERKDNVAYITQAAWLEHVGDGGHAERDSRTNTLYDERRRVYTVMQRARHTAYDVLEEVRYETSTTKGHAQMLTRMFLQPNKRMKVI